MAGLASSIIDLIFPARCVVCGALNPESLCPRCLSALPYITPPICRRCGKPCLVQVDECSLCAGGGGRDYSALRSLALFEGPMRDVVHALKYSNGRKLAPILASAAVERVGSEVSDSRGRQDRLIEVDLVTCVPLYPRKQSERGYNQAELVARAVSRLIRVPFARLLKQVRPTADQSQLTAEQRRKNVKSAYAYRPAFRRRSGDARHWALGDSYGGTGVEGRQILLVDDVFTTGATVAECSRVLAAAGAGDVRVLTLARAEHVLESGRSLSRSVVASERTSPG